VIPPPRSRRQAAKEWRCASIIATTLRSRRSSRASVGRKEGRLDILVNNAALIHDELQSPLPFWEKPLAASVDLLDVGLRSSLVASYYAAPLLIEAGRGLVVFTSAPGAVHYQYGAAYGAHKAGMDKSAADMAVDLAADPDVLAVSGRTLIAAEVAEEYGISDRDGRHPPSVRDLMSVEPATYHGRIRR
jgi:NAD(P)-dependent dehydrogenase (short-subunit alcohol dehydrogenase family)